MEKIIYIASPITIGDPATIKGKVADIIQFIYKAGHLAYPPMYMEPWEIKYPIAYEDVLEYDLKWLEKCDILYRVEGESKGADIEMAHARKLNIPIVKDIKQLKKIL